MKDSSRPDIVKGLPTRHGIIALIAGIFFSFFFYVSILQAIEDRYFPLEANELLHNTLSKFDVFAIKFLIGLTACIIDQTIQYPFVMSRINNSVYQFQLKKYIIQLPFMISGIIILIIIIGKLCVEIDCVNELYTAAILLAIITYVIPWIDFVRKYKRESMQWVIVTLLLSIISALAYSYII